MYEKRIAKGMRWLDKERPGWIDKIDLNVLDTQSGCRCILGQVFRDNETGKSGYAYIHDAKIFPGGGLTEHGFACDCNYSVLDEEWIAAIRQRQQQPKPIITPAPAKPAERPAAHVALTAVCLR